VKVNATAAGGAVVADEAIKDNKNNRNDQGKPKSKGLAIKILIPVLIIVVIAGIYIFKNNEQGTTPDQNIPKQSNDKASTAPDYNSSEFDLNATENLDMEKILSYGLPVIIDFGADSCIPCKQMAPVLIELNEELRGKAIVKFVDVWKNADAAQVVPLKVIPTQFFFDKNGTPYVPKDAENSSFILYGTKETEEHVFTAHEGGMDKEEILTVLKELGME